MKSIMLLYILLNIWDRDLIFSPNPMFYVLRSKLKHIKTLYHQYYAKFKTKSYHTFVNNWDRDEIFTKPNNFDI